MNSSLLRVIFTLGLVAAVIPAVLLVAPRVEAGIESPVIGRYLERMGVNWKRDDKDANVFRVTKTAGLKRAERVELVISNIPDKDLITVRAFPKVEGKYLSVGTARDKEGLMRAMLQRNATAFGAYFIDEDNDIGFRYIFTTESGLGYLAFQTAVTELLRIADEVMVPLYTTYR
jgi:hypothetical protein